MAKEQVGVILTMDDIRKPPAGSVYKPSRKRKQVATESNKVVQKPPNKKVVQLKELQKKVQEVASTTFLVPTKTRSGAIGKKTTTSDLVVSVKKKKLRKMVLLEDD